MPDGQVVFEISADGKKAMASINDITNAIEKAGKQWDQSVGNSTKSMESAFTKALDINRVKDWALKAGKAMLDFGMDCINVASDLAEVQNVVDVTFGEGAAQIDSWAKTAQTQFGLTEIQAKKFTSTLGAMMKSSGMAGPEIVKMSEDLAGLAADMASFYNLDFETAFQKIRSGISGETEPLKQLGINMSVANLEAYALTQGITKAFDKMSQGEQTMLRYQYLMQATADAQGDFARTADGYANAQRRVQTAIESIKASVGNMLMQVIEPATVGLANFLEQLTKPKPKTVLDEFADIDLQTQEKITEIQKTAAEAEILIDTLGRISSTVHNYGDAGPLTSFISALSRDIQGLDGALTQAKNGDVSGALSSLATALSTQITGDPDKWKTLLNAISGSLPAATAATLSDEEQTAAWMAAAAAAADDLGGDYSSMWTSLLQALGNNAGAAISALAGGDSAASAMESLANGANALKSDSPGVWRSLLGVLKNVDGLQGMFSDSGAAGNVKALAEALSGNSPDESRAEAWRKFLSALQENSGALTGLTQKSADETAAWLGTMADAANKLNPANAQGWNALFSALLTGMPGLENGENGSFLENLAQEFLAMGNQSEIAKAGLQALGWSTEDIDTAQKQWLDTCKNLVATIPGLNSVINTQTGEIQGGMEALTQYTETWQKEQEKMLLWEAYYAKERALIERKANEYSLELDVITQQARVDRLKKQYEELGGADFFKNNIGINTNGEFYLRSNTKEAKEMLGVVNDMGAAVNSLREAEANYNKEVEANAAATQELADTYDGLVNSVGEATKATEAGAASLSTIQAAASGDADALDQVKTALKNAADAWKELNDYQYKVRAETEQSVGQVIKGFDSLGKQVSKDVWEFNTPVEEADRKLMNMNKQLAELEKKKGLATNAEDAKKLQAEYDKLNAQINEFTGENQKPSVQNMTDALNSQIAYMKQYQDYLAQARALGVSEDILASLSDGSKEAFDYLKALSTTSSTKEIEALNKAYADAAEASKGFTDELTKQKLAADEAFDGMVSKAQEATEGLNLGETAYASVAETVQGIISALQDKRAAVASEVDAILAEMARLANAGSFGAGFGFGTISFSGPVSSAVPFAGSGLELGTIGNHADGLDFVPFDNYLARLHEGESVLTAAEAQVWRDFKYGQRANANTIDYGLLGTAMWENAPQMGGGNVYMNGQVVGRLISAQQADSLRAMERSGFQR